MLFVIFVPKRYKSGVCLRKCRVAVLDSLIVLIQGTHSVVMYTCPCIVLVCKFPPLCLFCELSSFFLPLLLLFLFYNFLLLFFLLLRLLIIIIIVIIIIIILVRLSSFVFSVSYPYLSSSVSNFPPS